MFKITNMYNGFFFFCIDIAQDHWIFLKIISGKGISTYIRIIHSPGGT